MIADNIQCDAIFAKMLTIIRETVLLKTRSYVDVDPLMQKVKQLKQTTYIGLL